MLIYKFLAKNTVLSTSSGFRDVCFELIILPLVLNTRSDGELVAQIVKYNCIFILLEKALILPQMGCQIVEQVVIDFYRHFQGRVTAYLPCSLLKERIDNLPPSLVSLVCQ